jgi:hypothetical protein
MIEKHFSVSSPDSDMNLSLNRIFPLSRAGPEIDISKVLFCFISGQKRSVFAYEHPPPSACIFPPPSCIL